MNKLAIISTNARQYSESFIRTQIDHLPFDKVVYSEGYLPTKVSKDLGATFQSIPRSLWNSTPEKALAKSFKTEKVTVVLAEYGPSGVAVMNVCQALNIPLVVHFHGYDAYRDDVLASYGQQYSKLFDIASAIIAVSVDMRQQLIKLGCAAEKVSHIPYGVDTELFAPESAIEGNGQWLACGRFVKKKGPLLTLQAFKKVVDRFPHAQLYMIGDGELVEACEKLVVAHNLEENIQFLGVLSHVQISERMKQSAGFVQHSIRTDENDSEGTPLSILEAMASGLPVIATRHAGIKDVVEEGQTGILVDEGDIEGMANAMIALMNEVDRAQEMGRKGREIIRQKYTYKKYVAALTEVINKARREYI